MKKLNYFIISLLALSCSHNESFESKIIPRTVTKNRTLRIANKNINNKVNICSWYTNSAKQINELEEIGINLFFVNDAGYPKMTPTNRKIFIEQIINALDENSKIVLNIENFLTKGWFHEDNMGDFINYWGNNDKVYGFLLRDDVITAEYPSKGYGFPSDAIWKVRWYYRKIKNLDFNNGFNKDISNGKPIMVSLDFGYPFKNFKARFMEGRKSLKTNYSNLPPNFFNPGDSWDIILPYYYPHRNFISLMNEKYIMEQVHNEMYEIFSKNLSNVIPIIQTVSEDNGNEFEVYPLEYQPNLSIQYESLFNHGLLSSKKFIYYSANSHPQVTRDLLHINNQKNDNTNTTHNNGYYVEAKKLNNEHKRRFN